MPAMNKLNYMVVILNAVNVLIMSVKLRINILRRIMKNKPTYYETVGGGGGDMNEAQYTREKLRKQWEYHSIDYDNFHDFQSKLNKRGSEGWELVNYVIRGENNYNGFMKRELNRGGSKQQEGNHG